MIDFERAEPVSLKEHPELNEKWVQNLIGEDPSILGLGDDLDLRQKERMQPNAGRLDLLLQDSEDRRYEIEIQLDESRIIRTIEYWDIERKRYPQYDHCAVLVAEDITSRFLNVISLFNGTIPLIALQMRAFRVGGELTLIFTKVMDELPRGLVDEDEEGEGLPATRSDWEKKTSMLPVVDNAVKIAKQVDPKFEPAYKRHYIGFSRGGTAFNFCTFRPKKSTLTVEIKLPQTSDVDAKIEQAGIETIKYSRSGRYRLQLSPGDLKDNADLIRDLMHASYQKRAE
jgi:hypothetical protein